MWNPDSGIFILNEILGKVKLDEGLVKENNKVLRDFLDTFVPKMKEVDKVFDWLYREPYYTGSFYSDLRISQPDEFDINLIIDMPFKNGEFSITSQLNEPNFVKYQSDVPKSGHGGTVLFENSYLISDLARAWFQSIIDRALESYNRPSTIKRVLVRQSGPARTLTLVKNNNAKIDVDLVPVIGCTLNMSRISLDRRVEAKVGRNLQAFLVPKPPNPLSAEARLMWRCHSPKPEEDIMYNVGCAKSVIKLLKLLRDKEKWSILASYYLKTVVMWMIIENSGTSDFWKENHIVERFFEALEKLAECVGRKKIPYIFNTDCNLIEKIGHQEAYDISNRLNSFIRNINRDRNYLRRIF
ncbi:cyclic GMP-AMP synthase-like receptor [Parasteatoda tepidariorum]|uniref:cyclic GMP-AMP synthase-like receptor n=1 Tax=Parasteatoda tepidariorum TaxID=114398 RepID=UPI00077F86F5|nr:cyclic GMP-AMP synthase-like [Parasteatoda tepidariorum]XP_015925556.1 cyclic GMP-AMP synthase-like [Parasteatoda tepidariorum]